MNIIRNEENVDIDLDVNVEVVNDWRPLQSASTSVVFRSSNSLKEQAKKNRESSVINNKKEKQEEGNYSFFGL
jgi:hypothetical protein